MVDKTKTNPAEKDALKVKKSQKQGFTIVGIAVVLLVITVVGTGTGGYLVHLSNTSPEFCASCHIMEKNVNSYLSSNNMDNIHAQANVQCKDCHDYSIPAEVSSGIRYITGNYSVNSKGELLPVSYSDDMCLKCHISDEYIAKATDFLHRNPHKSHNGYLDCKVCHISHGDQINYCGTCHDNGGQRMIGEEKDRLTTLR
jgi:nitrate/TMAO reductase-like tetraheme cytochrome c subunit